MTMTDASFPAITEPRGVRGKRRRFANGGAVKAESTEPTSGSLIEPWLQSGKGADIAPDGGPLSIEPSDWTGLPFPKGDPRNNPVPDTASTQAAPLSQVPAGRTVTPYTGDYRSYGQTANQRATQSGMTEEDRNALARSIGYTGSFDRGPNGTADQFGAWRAADPKRQQSWIDAQASYKSGAPGTLEAMGANARPQGEHLFFPSVTGTPAPIDINAPYDDPSLHRGTGTDTGGSSTLKDLLSLGLTGASLYSLWNKLFPGDPDQPQQPGEQTPKGDPDPNQGDGLTGGTMPIIPVTTGPLEKTGNVKVEEPAQSWDPAANDGQGGWKIPGGVSGLSGAIPGAIDALSGASKIPIVEVQELAGGIGGDTLTQGVSQGIEGGGAATQAESFFTKLNADPVGTITNLGLDVVGGLAGNALGKAVGGDQSGGSIGGTVGAIAGNFIPVIGQIPFLGSFIGATIGRIIGSFIGAHPTTGPISDSTITWGGDDKGNAFTLHDTKVDPGIRNAKNEREMVPKLTQVATGLGSSVQGSLTQAVNDIGGGVASMPNITIGTKYDKDSKKQKYYAGDDLQKGGKERLFDDPGQAIAFAIYTGLDKSKFGEGYDPKKLDTYKTQLRSVFEPKPAQQADPSTMSPEQLAAYVQSSMPPQGYRRGGKVDTPHDIAPEGGPLSGRYVDGPGGGQDDVIPAALSAGEFVIPSDAVAALGDGSSQEGGRRLDGMLQNIRRHKTSKGAKHPPMAKSPLEYLSR